MDTASNLILKALAGETRKVEIGGRRYTFSCIPTFRLMDEESGQLHDCSDSTSLLRTALLLQNEGRSPEANGVSGVRVLRGEPSQ